MVRESFDEPLGLKVDVDAHSGFCNGVIRAINEAECYLAQSAPLYSIGALVHNNKELERLHQIGLCVIQPDQLAEIAGQTLIIRAHGEPPSTYVEAKKYKIRIIDCSCPVVLKLQQKIKEEYRRIKPMKGQIAILGKKGHAEVNGLIGQVDGDALILEERSQARLLDFNRPISLFAQTTQDPPAFPLLCRLIEALYRSRGLNPEDYFCAFNTICQQVSGRLPLLRTFAKEHRVIVFVCGKESSNGKVLFRACQSANYRSHMVENAASVSVNWFNRGDSVGICGATSTPKWLMEEIAEVIRTF
ncbi:MAG: 4-hydroxy-3-methylbut-2-enyl diphosphate reductase [Bacteroidetes bacterium]|nr:4-hydroxy-3-methylbut-2-enyl diphosphate reductase [Bacteroidota bacterium]